jgi:tRNA nucleotidyltransferase (CCA-adding enzyme)
MQNTIEAVTKQILKKITPSKEEYSKVEALSRKLEQKIALVCRQQGVQAVVRVEGSVAKDTWLCENPDIDVFMQLPTSIPRKNLGDVGLKVARVAAEGARQVERFAEHPYLEVFVDNYRVDIVPCYDAKPGEWQSATDRTPYHTDYIKKRLTKGLRGEVRLLKKFMQGVGVYGAEIKVGGFSGYLCELLIIAYGSFAQTVEAFAKYSRRVVIDIDNHFAGRENELSLLFPEPLVIVDPVDKARNVASAVLSEKLYTFIGAARAFMKKPSEEFFYPKMQKPLSAAVLKRKLDSRDSAVVFLVVYGFESVPDVLWGQLYRSKRSLRKLLELNDYKILRNAVWSNEKTLSVMVFELEQQVLPNVKKHLGPPLEREAECASFLAKYAESSQVVSGPYIEGGRWMVDIKRKNIDAVELLKQKLADGGKNVGVSELVAQAIKEVLTVKVNSEIGDVYKANEEFAVFLSGFLVGKPFWLEA